MSRKGIEGKMKRDIFIIGKLELLSMRDPVEQLNKFMGDMIFFEEDIVFNREKDIQRVKDSSIEEVDCVGGKERWIDMTRTERRYGS